MREQWAKRRAKEERLGELLRESQAALGEIVKWSGGWGLEAGVVELWQVADGRFKEAVRVGRQTYEVHERELAMSQRERERESQVLEAKELGLKLRACERFLVEVATGDYNGVGEVRARAQRYLREFFSQ